MNDPEAPPPAPSGPTATHAEASPPDILITDPPRSLLRALGQIGPGLILAGSIVGTGELIATTNLGAKVGFALLWLVLVSCFIKVFVQVELGRYAISSGDATLAGFRKLPGPGVMLVWWCLAMVLVTQMQIGAMIGGVAEAIHMAAPGVAPWFARQVAALDPAAGARLSARPAMPWAVLTTLVTIALLASGSYRLVERGSTFLVVTFTLMTVGCLVLLPGEHAIRAADLAEGLSFRIPDETALVAAFSMIGITGVGASELLAYPYWCLEKGYARRVGPRDDSPAWLDRAKGWVRVMKLDAWVSMVIYTIATVAFYLLGAAELHERTGGKGLPEQQILGELAAMYRPVMGPRLAIVFVVIGAFAVLYSTLFAATAGNARILADFLAVNRFIDPARDDLRRRWVRVFCTVLPLAGLVLYGNFTDIVLMVTVGAVMQGVTLPLIGAAAVFLRYRRTDRRMAPGLIWDGLLWLSTLGLGLTAAYILWTNVGKLRGLLAG